MSDTNFSAIRARLRYETIEGFIEGYSRFISGGGMFIPMQPSKLKPIGTTVRFQFLLADGSTALLGEGVVLQVRSPDDSNPNAPVGMLIKFNKLSQESKVLVDRIVSEKGDGGAAADEIDPDPVEDEPPREDTTSEVPAEMASAAARELGDELTPAEEVPEENLDATRLEAGRDEQLTPIHDPEVSAGDALSENSDDVVESPQLHTDPPTREAPGFEIEPATVEADAADIVSSESVESAAEDSDDAALGPKKLAGREGGLQVLAFDNMSDEEMEDFEKSFSFGADDDDIDDMFSGLFGGGDAGEDEGGGFFGGGAEEEGESQQAVEIPLPDEEPEEEPEQIAEESEGVEEDLPFNLDDDDDVEESADDVEFDIEEEEEFDEAGGSEGDDLLAGEEFSVDDVLEDSEATDEGEEGALEAAEEESDDAAEADENEAAEDDAGLLDSAFSDDELDALIEGHDGDADEEGEALLEEAAEEEEEFLLEEEAEEEEDEVLLEDEASEEEAAEDEALLEDEAVEEEAGEEEAGEEEAGEEELLLEEVAEEELLLEEEVDEADDVNSDDLEDAIADALLGDDDEEDEILLEEAVEEPVLDSDDASFIEEASESAAEEVDEDDDLDALIDFSRSPREHEAGDADGSDDVADEREASDELHDLLEHLEDDDDEEPEMTLHLGSEAEVAEPEPDDEEDDSLAALLASAKKEIEEKHGGDEPSENGDILDQLLGEEVLPPPPSDAPAFNLPAEPKKKKGFFSKIFGNE